jgi:predicted dehydrogenase
MAEQVRIALIGAKFMGKAHSNAWSQVCHFFDRPVKPVLQVICGRDAANARAVADRWGWRHVETDWKKAVSREDVDLVDVCVPNHMHAVMAIAAIKAGKHVACEKPLAMSVREAQQMTAAAKAARDRVNFVWYNYRRVPALALARQLVHEDRVGKVFHVRAVYLQSWIINPDFPLIWRLQGDIAGTGSHGDLNAHILDAARFLTGDEITEVSAAMETFIKERPVGEMVGGLSATGTAKGRKGPVTVDDAVIMLARFAGGAVGTFEATRFAQGRKNFNSIEVNGEKGAIRFEFEDMNRLKFYDATRPAHVQGWTDIYANDGCHPYASAYWPVGHGLGYEHTFVNGAADILEALANRQAAQLRPDFADATRTQRVLEAASKSAKTKKWVKTGC